jgi:hypothetical protein
MPTTTSTDACLEIEPGVFLYTAVRMVEFKRDRVTLPLPDPKLASNLCDPTQPISQTSALRAASMMAAYERLLWLSREDRQRVVRCLRKAIGIMRLRAHEPGSVATVEACVQAGMVKL